MVTNSDFAQFLISKQLHQLPSRQALFNFIKYFCPLHDELTPNLLENYFSFILQFSYWRRQKTQLLEPLREDLAEFERLHHRPFGNETLSSLIELPQIVELENKTQLQQIIEKRRTPSNSVTQFKFKTLSNNQLLVIALKTNNEACIEVYKNLACIKNGELYPTLPHTRLSYNNLMELKQDRLQILQISPTNIAGFITRSKASDQGFILSGYLLDKESDFKGSLEVQSSIFNSLKTIESYFIDLGTDPEYLKITSDLKEAIYSLRQGRDHSLIKAQKALRQAQYSLKELFPNDKGIKHLVSELEISLISEDTCPNLIQPPQV